MLCHICIDFLPCAEIAEQTVILLSLNLQYTHFTGKYNRKKYTSQLWTGHLCIFHYHLKRMAIILKSFEPLRRSFPS